MNDYKILGIKEDATPEEIKQAYWKKALIYHPDRNSAKDAPERFIALTKAYENLMKQNNIPEVQWGVVENSYNDKFYIYKKKEKSGAITTFYTVNKNEYDDLVKLYGPSL